MAIFQYCMKWPTAFAAPSSIEQFSPCVNMSGVATQPSSKFPSQSTLASNPKIPPQDARRAPSGWRIKGGHRCGAPCLDKDAGLRPCVIQHGWSLSGSTTRTQSHAQSSISLFDLFTRKPTLAYHSLSPPSFLTYLLYLFVIIVHHYMDAVY